MTTRLFLPLACFFFAEGAFSQTPYLLQDLHQPADHLIIFVPGYQLSAHGTAYFEARTDLSGEWGLWAFDGHKAVMFQNAPPDIAQAVTAQTGFFFFSYLDATRLKLWKTEGIPGDATLLDTVPLPNANATEIPAACLGNTLIFSNYSVQHGHELWRSDGTPGGTFLLKDCRPGAAYGSPEGLTTVGALAFFRAVDGSGKMRLWRTDGTTDGTFSLTGDTLPAGQPWPTTLAAVGDTLFFQVHSPVWGTEVWKSDGTPGGTVKVKTTGLPTNSGFYADVVTIPGKYLFLCNDGAHGLEWWVSDGTDDGTHLLLDINPGPADFFPDFHTGGLYRLNGRFFFFRQNNGGEIWATDGTTDGTQLIQNIGPGTLTPLPATDHLVFCLLEKSNDELELWATDGTPNAAYVVRTWDEAGYVPYQCPSAVADDEVCFFFDQTQDPPYEWVWVRSDGTPAGTGFLGGAPDAVYENSNPSHFCATGDGTVFFRAAPESDQHKIWKTDGAAPSSVQVADNNVVFTYTDYGPVSAGGKVFWFASDSVLRVSDGDGPVQQLNLQAPLGGWPGSFAAFQNELYFLTDYGKNLWRSDGTPGGTFSFFTAPDSSKFSGLTATTDSLYLILDVLSNGGSGIFSHSQNLWRSDGTAAGTAGFEVISTVGSTLFPSAVNDRFSVSTAIWGDLTQRALIVGGFPVVTLPSAPYAPLAGLEVAGDRLFILDAPLYGATGVTYRFWVYENGQLALLHEFGAVSAYNEYAWDTRDRLQSLPDGSVFFGAGPANDVELWRSDGTAAGTVEWQDINPNGSANPDNFVRVDAQHWLFSAFDGSATGWWVTGGAGGGAFKVADVLPAAPSSVYLPVPNITNAFLQENRLFFSMNDRVHGQEPWVLELPDSLVSGAAATVRPLQQLTLYPNPAAETLQFFWENAAPGDGFVSVFDAAGHLVLQQKIVLAAGQGATLRLGLALPPGVYALLAQDALGRRAAGKFVVEGF